MITTTLINSPLTARQKYALAVMDAGSPWSDSPWMTAVEVAAGIKQRYGMKQFGHVSILLSTLICRGLARRQVSGGDVFYSRTGVQW
jgi:hypothetical protein